MKIIIETPRLILKEFELIDAAGFYAMNNDPEVIRYTGDHPFTSIIAAKKFIQGYSHYQEYGFGRWTILLKTNQSYLGFCGLKYSLDKSEVDLGYRLIRKYWGQAYATEAAQACLTYGFNQFALKKIVGRAMKANPASYRVLEKIGMQYEKSFEEEHKVWLQYCINQA